MSFYEDPPPDAIFGIPIFHKVYAFMVALTNWQKQCPKAHRFATAQFCHQLGLNIFKLLLRANLESNYRRITLLREASLSLDELKIFIRLSKDVGAMTLKQYGQFQILLQDIGKQLGGWIKATQTKNPAS